METQLEYSYATSIAAELKKDLEEGKEFHSGAAMHEEDFRAWGSFMKKYQPAAILELGTGSGSFSRFIQKQVYWFITIDNQVPENPPDGFIQLDIFSEIQQIREFIELSPKPFLLYCDNGNKIEEVKIFSEFLIPYFDYLAVHDYGIEIFPSDIPDYFEKIVHMGLTAFFKKRDYEE